MKILEFREKKHRLVSVNIKDSKLIFSSTMFIFQQRKRDRSVFRKKDPLWLISAYDIQR